MSVSDYIHPGWGDGARRIRQIFREISDSKGPAGVESCESWCGSDVIAQDGRCISCNAMRRPPRAKIENLPRASVLPAPPRRPQPLRQLERPRPPEPPPNSYRCGSCSARTTNSSRVCYHCKTRREVEAKKQAERELVRIRHKEPANSRPIMLGDVPCNQCLKCKSVYFDTGPCPMCQWEAVRRNR